MVESSLCPQGIINNVLLVNNWLCDVRAKSGQHVCCYDYRTVDILWKSKKL